MAFDITKFKDARCFRCKKRLAWENEAGALFVMQFYVVEDRTYCYNCYVLKNYAKEEL